MFSRFCLIDRDISHATLRSLVWVSILKPPLSLSSFFPRKAWSLPWEGTQLLVLYSSLPNLTNQPQLRWLSSAKSCVVPMQILETNAWETQKLIFIMWEFQLYLAGIFLTLNTQDQDSNSKSDGRKNSNNNLFSAC